VTARVVAGPLFCLMLGAVAPTGLAQSASAPLFHPSDLGWAGAFVLGSYGISRFDARLAKYFQKPVHQRDPTMRGFANVFTHVQETTLSIGGIVTYGIARLANAREVERIALHVSESVVAASLTSQIIRGPVGRARPKDATPIFDDPYEFHWFKGFGHFEYRAFPSIHSSSAFAAATTIVAETRHRSPRSVWYVAPLAYTLAAGPGYARMYLGQHWASDVFMGAFVGAFYGQRVVDYAHAHPNNPVDRAFLDRSLTNGASIVPGRGQVTFSFSARF
jgi:membrane-associated phospholipid phosphatase